jgi:hypothetical protein
MPKSKHRRKPAGKAVPHPGRAKSGRPPPEIRQAVEALRKVLQPRQRGLRSLPLFDRDTIPTS